MYNEYEEYDLKTKINYKVWGRIIKEMWKYPGLFIGSVISMIGTAFGETMFIKYICSDGLERFLGADMQDPAFIKFVIGMVMFIVVIGLCTTSFLMFGGVLERKFYEGLTKETFAK